VHYVCRGVIPEGRRPRGHEDAPNRMLRFAEVLIDEAWGHLLAGLVALCRCWCELRRRCACPRDRAGLKTRPEMGAGYAHVCMPWSMARGALGTLLVPQHGCPIVEDKDCAGRFLRGSKDVLHNSIQFCDVASWVGAGDRHRQGADPCGTVGSEQLRSNMSVRAGATPSLRSWRFPGTPDNNKKKKRGGRGGPLRIGCLAGLQSADFPVISRLRTAMTFQLTGLVDSRTRNPAQVRMAI